MNIKSNHHWLQVLYWYELTDKERKEFDYLQEGGGCFFRYKGATYDLGEFMPVPQSEPARQELNKLSEWHGYQSDSYFSGIVIRYSDDCEYLQAGTYFS